MTPTPPYSSSQIANFFLVKAREEKRSLTMLKLIKISYIAHGWNLALQETALVNEAVEAWQYGPVIPSIYHEFKRFERNPIDTLALEFDFSSFESTAAKLPMNDHKTKAILEKVWDVYKTVTGGSLIDLTHASGTPWEAVYSPQTRNEIIPNESIKNHYVKLLNQLVSE